MHRYMVVEKKKTFLKGAITAQQLEDLINEHAEKGWDLDRIIAGETARFMGVSDKNVFLLVFKQPTT